MPKIFHEKGIAHALRPSIRVPCVESRERDIRYSRRGEPKFVHREKIVHREPKAIIPVVTVLSDYLKRKAR